MKVFSFKTKNLGRVSSLTLLLASLGNVTGSAWGMEGYPQKAGDYRPSLEDFEKETARLEIHNSSQSNTPKSSVINIIDKDSYPCYSWLYNNGHFKYSDVFDANFHEKCAEILRGISNGQGKVDNEEHPDLKPQIESLLCSYFDYGQSLEKEDFLEIALDNKEHPELFHIKDELRILDFLDEAFHKKCLEILSKKTSQSKNIFSSKNFDNEDDLYGDGDSDQSSSVIEKSQISHKINSSFLQPQEIRANWSLEKIALAGNFKVSHPATGQTIYDHKTGDLIDLASFANTILTLKDAQHEIKTGYRSGNLGKMLFSVNDGSQVEVDGSFHHILHRTLATLADNPIGKKLSSKGMTATVVTKPRGIPLDPNLKYKAVYYGLLLQKSDEPEGVMLFQSSDSWKNFDRHNTRDISNVHVIATHPQATSSVQITNEISDFQGSGSSSKPYTGWVASGSQNNLKEYSKRLQNTESDSERQEVLKDLGRDRDLQERIRFELQKFLGPAVGKPFNIIIEKLENSSNEEEKKSSPGNKYEENDREDKN